MSSDEKLNKFIKSPEELKGAKTPSYIERIEHRVIPLVDSNMGSRFRMVRQKMKMDQGEIAELLGSNQKQISNLEIGRLEHAPFTLGRMRAVFGKNFHFILFGTGDANYWNGAQINRDYWHERLKVRRKPGSGAWITERRREQMRQFFEDQKSGKKSVFKPK